MNPQDWYLHILFRLDRIQAIINALNVFYDAPTEQESLEALRVVQRIEGKKVQISC